jgi:uncharacterized membrane protein
MFGLVQLTREAAVVVAGNLRWMAWNVVLALVPLVLAVRLFRDRGQPRTRAWWLGAAAFVAFLPNAPYVLTDVVHLFDNARVVPSDAVLSLAVLPEYVAFMAVGLVAYVASIMLVEGYVGARWSRHVRLTAHGLSALGIYLGRVVRLNSWDLVVRPGAVAHAVASTLSVGGVLLLAIAFGVLLVATDAAVWAWGVRRRLAQAG